MIYKNITEKTLNGLVYIKGKFLRINTKEFYNILKLLKETLIKKIDNGIDYINIILCLQKYYTFADQFE